MIKPLNIPWPDRLLVSVSGGRTSAVMAHLIKTNAPPTTEVVYVFANTTLEHDDTYRFLEDIDKHFGLGLVLLEGRIRPGKTTSWRRVESYDRLRRNGELMIELSKKYGVVNNFRKNCTHELKRNCIEHYAKWTFGYKAYTTAIGIRADENRRVSAKHQGRTIVYPLNDWWPMTREDVLDYMSQFDFDLRIPHHLGNCVPCFEKGQKKLALAYRDAPEKFDVFRQMEKEARRLDKEKEFGLFTIYRNGRTTDQMIELFHILQPSQMDTAAEGGCSESCELYEMEER